MFQFPDLISKPGKNSGYHLSLVSSPFYPLSHPSFPMRITILVTNFFSLRLTGKKAFHLYYFISNNIYVTEVTIIMVNADVKKNFNYP